MKLDRGSMIELERLATEIAAIEQAGHKACRLDAVLIGQLVDHLRHALDVLVETTCPTGTAWPWWSEWDRLRRMGQ